MSGQDHFDKIACVSTPNGIQQSGQTGIRTVRGKEGKWHREPKGVDKVSEDTQNSQKGFSTGGKSTDNNLQPALLNS